MNAAVLNGFAGCCAAALLVYLLWALLFPEDLG